MAFVSGYLADSSPEAEKRVWEGYNNWTQLGITIPAEHRMQTHRQMENGRLKLRPGRRPRHTQAVMRWCETETGEGVDMSRRHVGI